MDRSEFETLLGASWPVIRAVARRFDPGPGVEDICQEVVIVAWRRREAVGDPQAFGAWVRGIALNVGRAHARRWQGRMGPLREGDRVVPDPAQEIVDKQALETALRRLTEREQHTIMARDLAGWSLAEIASSFGEPVGSTKSRISRAHGKLRRELRRMGWTRSGPSDGEEDSR